MKVKATARGFDGSAVREPGDIFDMPKDAQGSWFKPVYEPEEADNKFERKRRDDKQSL